MLALILFVLKYAAMQHESKYVVLQHYRIQMWSDSVGQHFEEDKRKRFGVRLNSKSKLNSCNRLSTI